jgi:hypothetical protein
VCYGPSASLYPTGGKYLWPWTARDKKIPYMPRDVIICICKHMSDGAVYFGMRFVSATWKRWIEQDSIFMNQLRAKHTARMVSGKNIYTPTYIIPVIRAPKKSKSRQYIVLFKKFTEQQRMFILAIALFSPLNVIHAEPWHEYPIPYCSMKKNRMEYQFTLEGQADPVYVWCHSPSVCFRVKWNRLITGIKKGVSIWIILGDFNLLLEGSLQTGCIKKWFAPWSFCNVYWSLVDITTWVDVSFPPCDVIHNQLVFGVSCFFPIRRRFAIPIGRLERQHRHAIQ